MTFLALIAALAVAAPKVGDVAPQFSITDVDGKPVVLRELLARGPVVLAFFPKAFTPGCTRELTAFASESAQRAAALATVVAISGDDAATLRRFRDELHARYRFVADARAELIDLYGVRQWPLRMAKRTTFVIAPGGRVARVDAGGDAVDAARALQGLAAP